MIYPLPTPTVRSLRNRLNSGFEVNVSPVVPTWPPDTAEALEEFLEAGLAVETHRIDYKREVPQGSKSRRGLIATLASFATDGGWVIIGVEEQDAGPIVPNPISLGGVREQLDSLCRTVPDPPLYIETAALRKQDDPTRGYVVVRIPPSPHGIHAVGGRYYGRRDNQKAPLGDAEIERIMHVRRTASDALISRVEEELRHAPQVPLNRFYTTFVRCEPITPHPAPMWGSTRNEDQPLLHEMLQQAQRDVAPLHIGSVWWPWIQFASDWGRHAGGKAVRSPGLTNLRSGTGSADDLGSLAGELVWLESGAVQSWTAGARHCPDDDLDDVVDDTGIISVVAQTCAIAGRVGEHMEFDGQWRIAVRIDGLHRLTARSRTGGIMKMGSRRYPDSRPYVRTATATTSQLRSDLRAVAAELLQPFLRTIETSDLLDERATDGA